MKRRLKTVQSSLFLTYSKIIIIVLIVFVLFFYFWVSNLLRLSAFNTISALSASTSDKLDIEIQKMDSVSMNILYSSIVKDRFDTYIKGGHMTETSGNSPTDVAQTRVSSLQNSRELIDIIFAIIGASRPVQQIYLYNFYGKVFGTGFDNRQRDISVTTKPWYKDIINSQSKKYYVSVPMKDEEVSKFVSQKKDIYYISLCRLYYDKFSVPQGIIEVKQYYDLIFKTLKANEEKNLNGAKVYIYNSDGTLIYPLKNTSPAASDSYYFKLKKSLSQNKSSITAVNPYTKEKELLDFKYSDYSGWTTIVAVSQNKLLAPVFEFTRMLLLVTVIIILGALTLSFFAARKITIPINNLRKAIKNMNLNSNSKPSPLKLTSDLDELEDLNQVFRHMNAELIKSHDDLILSQKHELQARILALQSQMNPHFLYNTLANLSVMAEEGMDEQIIEMCSNLSDMLRYVSSDQSPYVSLGTEIEYAEKYLRCMKFRFGDKLTYKITVDDELKRIKVPKMIIQPLVENSIKYSSHLVPPWEVEIFGYKSNTMWKITVKDNGSGFDREKLANLRNKINLIDTDGLLPSLELDGMGLLNIYIRLRLHYKNQAIFQLSNNVEKGASITIGGSLYSHYTRKGSANGK